MPMGEFTNSPDPAQGGHRAEPNDVTLRSYEEAAELYAACTPGPTRATVSDFLDSLVELVPGGQVLELGSGPGRDAIYLESRGLRVQRSDATPAFIELMRRDRHQARMLDVRSDDLGGPWDAILASAVLLHLRRVEFERVIERAYDAVRPGGILAFTVKEGEGEGWSHARLQQPRWFVYWREPDLRTIVQRNGWNVVSIDRHVTSHATWIEVLCRADAQLAT